MMELLLRMVLCGTHQLVMELDLNDLQAREILRQSLSEIAQLPAPTTTALQILYQVPQQSLSLLQPTLEQQAHANQKHPECELNNGRRQDRLLTPEEKRQTIDESNHEYCQRSRTRRSCDLRLELDLDPVCERQYTSQGIPDAIRSTQEALLVESRLFEQTAPPQQPQSNPPAPRLTDQFRQEQAARALAYLKNPDLAPPDGETSAAGVEPTEQGGSPNLTHLLQALMASASSEDEEEDIDVGAFRSEKNSSSYQGAHRQVSQNGTPVDFQYTTIRYQAQTEADGRTTCLSSLGTAEEAARLDATSYLKSGPRVVAHPKEPKKAKKPKKARKRQRNDWQAKDWQAKKPVPMHCEKECGFKADEVRCNADRSPAAPRCFRTGMISETAPAQNKEPTPAADTAITRALASSDDDEEASSLRPAKRARATTTRHPGGLDIQAGERLDVEWNGSYYPATVVTISLDGLLSVK